MKLSLALPVLAASSAYSISNPIIASRQANIRRGLVDVCAGLDADLKLLEVIKNGKPLVTGHLDVCLCVSLIPNFIEVNLAAKAAVVLLGKAEVAAIIEGLIRAAPGHQTCNYPAHAQPFCDAGNPCNFQCSDGYHPSPANKPTSCVCSAPNTECNGKCGSFPHGCGSAVPGRRRSIPQCIDGRELCGVPGGVKGRRWECVHTKRDIESCGGCMVDSPFGTTTSPGVDCSSILHASEVSCDDGKCNVEKCTNDFVPSASGDACVPAPVNSKRQEGSLSALSRRSSEGIVGDIVQVGGKAVAVAIVDRDAPVSSQRQGVSLGALSKRSSEGIVGDIVQVDGKAVAIALVDRNAPVSSLGALSRRSSEGIVGDIVEVNGKAIAIALVDRDADGITLANVEAQIDARL